jgi:hypothetical protein
LRDIAIYFKFGYERRVIALSNFGEVATFGVETRGSSTPKRRSKNHRIQPVATPSYLLKEKKNLLLSLVA